MGQKRLGQSLSGDGFGVCLCAAWNRDEKRNESCAFTLRNQVDDSASHCDGNMGEWMRAGEETWAKSPQHSEGGNCPVESKYAIDQQEASPEVELFHHLT